MMRCSSNPGARGRLRRPSGEPPPIPREPGWTRSLWLALVVLALGVGASSLLRGAFVDTGASLLRSVQDARSPAAEAAARWFDLLTDFAVVTALRWGSVAVLVVYRRWRHLVVLLASFVVTDWLTVRALSIERPIPEGVAPLSERVAFWFPSRPVAAFAISVFAMPFVLVPASRSRRRALWVASAAAVLAALSRIVLAADYPVDALYPVALGYSVAAVAFAAFVPGDVFPVSYRRGGKAAHLDLGGERGKAIVRAMREQLGLSVTEVEPFGLKGSGGSSPLRMRVEELDGHLFAKIYSRSHLRADRWYRTGRTLLYGQLEDEVPFGSVKRLVEYEDYALRLLDDVGIPVARTHGIVALTPNEEYMVVTEFFEGARNIGDSEIDDAVIDEGLRLVRTLWNEGLAHRDLKPANLLAIDGHLQLVDVSGLEVRPTAWRQAVDLANMMLTLALQTDPDRVYERATLVFSPEEIAEAFASAVGLAIPTQVQQRLKADQRPLLRRFKELAPPHPPVSIQRWSGRRIGLAVAAFLGTLLLAGMFLDSIRAGLV